MDEFERAVLEKFPPFPGYRTGAENDADLAHEWYSAYQRLVEWLHGRSKNGEMIRRAEQLMGRDNATVS